MKSDKATFFILSFAALIFVFNHFLFNPLAGEAPILTELDDLQKQTLSTLNDMSKLLISLSTALFGLVGYFAMENYKAAGTIERKFRIDLIAAFCATAISIDFGYIAMEKLVELLSNGIFQPYDNLISLPRNLQVIFFLIALFFCARLIYRNLFKPENPTPNYEKLS